jgi:hypothetical protein
MMGTSWVEGGEIRYISDLTQLFQRFLNHNAFFYKQNRLILHTCKNLKFTTSNFT